ncbi:hypothetical protein Sphch_1620 [Sphingobium chlorophenolicum L-1]|uniref:Uncharacterized protein n=1 Tax=Sphingobium chlorophenolicum L-1 TaxID=690566 RepID=F6EZH8_SPHCR|nr:hypothetical protein [Sphingobium chlorophenolicum]AEG49308.1 hypothetical protein Sphch_1620 [Sphingobium chlorophenolicum L-1]
MVGDMLLGSAAIAAILSGNAQAHGQFLSGERMRDGACVPGHRVLPGATHLPCCVPARRAVPPLCPRS